MTAVDAGFYMNDDDYDDGDKDDDHDDWLMISICFGDGVWPHVN